MKKILLIFLVCSLSLVCKPLIAQDAKVTSLISKPLSDIPGKELLMITVEYPPGSSDPGPPPQRASSCLCAGWQHRHGRERRKARNPYGRTDVLRRSQRYSHSWSQREQDDASQVIGGLAQRQRCTCSDSGEVAWAAKTSRQRHSNSKPATLQFVVDANETKLTIPFGN